MARRNQRYEAAFQDFLRSRGVPYIPVNEARQAIFAGTKVKSFDFLVYPGGAAHWIVDIKGRQFPYVGSSGAKRYWENWVTREDLTGLEEWEAVFGQDFRAYFVFAYQLGGPPDKWPPGRPHCFQNEHYSFLAVALSDYEPLSRPRSEQWDTVSVPTASFQEIAHPAAGLMGVEI